MRLKADLHVHTALSPCAAQDMTPPAIVSAAVKAGLNMIAICDHNSAGNVRAVQVAAAAAPTAAGAVAVIAGMEITTAEEVHVVGLFPDAERALAAAGAVQSTLPAGRTPPAGRGAAARGFGVQRLMDAAGRTRRVEPAMLAAASTLDLTEALALVHEHGGLAIAAHVDRPSFSVLSQLGMIPPDARFDALELSVAGCRAGRAGEVERLGLPVVCSSDGHSPEEVGAGFTVFEAGEASFGELALALAGRDGRGIVHA
jgi:hypothetical protein